MNYTRSFWNKCLNSPCDLGEKMHSNLFTSPPQLLFFLLIIIIYSELQLLSSSMYVLVTNINSTSSIEQVN